MKTKRIISFVLILMLTLSNVVFAADLKDVTPKDWFYNDVQLLINKGIVSGYPDGTFKPKANVGNSEALKLIMAATNIKPTEVDKTIYKNWADGYVQAAGEKGIVNPATFDKNGIATREKVAEMFVKALGKKPSSQIKNYFMDTKNPYVEVLYELEIVKGTQVADGIYFKPKDAITRAEVSAIVSRANAYYEELKGLEESNATAEQIPAPVVDPKIDTTKPAEQIPAPVVDPKIDTTNSATPPTATVYKPKYSSEQLKLWGLGTVEEEYVSNNRDYDWYIDQVNTGKYSDSNCGPTSVTMAIKWYDKNFSLTTEDARNTYLPSGGWWYTTDMYNYLEKYNVPIRYVNNKGEKTLIDSLKQGNIMILCINTKYIKYNDNPEQKVGKFYTISGGHFLIVKGYIKVDGITYFEVYDPNSWNTKYSDGSLKGKDRYYKSDELLESVENWWNYYIQVTPKTSSVNARVKYQTAGKIPVQFGGSIKSSLMS